MRWLGLTPEQWFEYAGFLAVAGASLVTALGVLFAPRVLHAAVWLLFCLLSVAGLYALLGAHVVFAIQVLVYAGAIAVMIIFAVVLLERGAGRGILGGNQHLFAGLVGAGAVGAVVIPALAYVCWKRGLPAAVVAPPADQTNVAAIGQLFLTRHLLAFELISVVLLVAMIGAIVLARPERHARQVREELAAEAAACAGGEGEIADWRPPLSAGKEKEGGGPR